MNEPTKKPGRRTTPSTGSTGRGLKSKEKLFQSAQELFAQKGFRDVSVREIASRAGVNSALVGYYFGGKKALFDEVYRSYAGPLSSERMKRLRDITGNNRKPSIAEILKAWLVPWLRAKDDPEQNALHVRFTANVSAERWKHQKKAAQFTEQTHTAFIDALHECLPHLSRNILTWRLHFIVGAIAFGIRDPESLRAFSNGRCNSADSETALAQVLPFAIEGLCAPAPE
jgi:AcrR family transcriptional regulator